MSFPIHEGVPPRYQGALPDRVDVVVVGSGVIGVMTAWFLAEKGLRVLICEKGRVAGEQSSRNWGWVRQQGRDPAELPISVESLAIWHDLVRELGEGLGFRQTGVMYLADNPADLDSFERWLTHARAHNLDSRMLGREEVARMIPGHAGHWPGALWTASDARAEPWTAVPLMAEGAVRRGVVIRENCAVRALDVAAGRIAGVVTEAGRVACDQVVVAAGAWSRLLLGPHGVRFPQLSVLASVAETDPMPEVFAGGAADGNFAFRRRLDGGYSIAPSSHHDFFIGRDAFASFGPYLPVLKRDLRSTRFRAAAPAGFPDAWGQRRRWSADEPSPFEAMRILNPAPNRATLARVQDAFARALPALGRPVLRTAWAGMIDTLPDVVPIVDRVAAIPGLVLATGMCGHGFGIGPGMGRVIASLVAGEAPGHDLSRFRLSRFSDGSKIAPGPGL